MPRPPPPSTLFPYTTLFRSRPFGQTPRAFRVSHSSRNTAPLRLRRFATQASTRCWRSLMRSEEHTSELQSHSDLVCRLLLEKKKQKNSRRLTKGANPRVADG